MARIAAGIKRRKTAPATAGTPPSAASPEEASDSRPVTRSRTTAARLAEADAAGSEADALAFLSAAVFEEAVHVPALYRLGADAPSGTRSAVRERGCPATADPDIAGFPNAFSVVDLNDRRGVWQTEPPLVKALGEDPRKQHRNCGGLGCDSPRTPAGLKNLGATCYLNSLLQYLFFNIDFRQSLLGVPSESAVVRALQRVFALLTDGERSTVDPAEFVTAASIDALEQADATEFSALLLDWLQRELGRDQGASQGNFISSLFEGEVSQVLACMQDATHTFERRENFYELRARLTPAVASSRVGSVEQVESNEVAKSSRGKKQGNGKAKSAPLPPVRLEHLLQETAFPDEILDGANQYHCPRCDRKVDARKTTRLAKLPPYLHVTIERYHYDRHKGERRKLNRAVSLPRRLELRLRAPPLQPTAGVPTPVETAVPVVYECIGYLEHVSDSAHSGHYTATLLQEEDAGVVEDALQSATQGSQCGGDLPFKRRRYDGADAAAGLPRRGTWWTLDDATVTAVSWAPDAGEAGNGSGDVQGTCVAADPSRCCAPDRIESAAAYLVLYRRSDHLPGQLTSPCPTSPQGTFSLPASLAAFVATANSCFAMERDKYTKHSKAVESFLAERRRAVNGLIQALQEQSTTQAKAPGAEPSTFSFVPSVWLNAFLRGEDRRLEDLLNEDASVTPVMYGQSLLRARGCRDRHVIDPLAVWFGEVKLVPTAALDALGGSGGLDGSLFLRAEEAFGTEACGLVWQLFQLWCQEQQQVACLLKDGRLTAAEARALEAQGRGDEAVWVSLRVQHTRRRLARATSGRSMAPLRADWRSFVAEAHRTRWGGSSSSSAAGSAPDDTDPSAGTGEGKEAGASPSKQAVVPAECSSNASAAGVEVSLLAGLTCMHGMVNRPRAGFLARRADVVRLLEASSAKERLYMELWPNARAVPRFYSGLPGGQLLSFCDICTECRGDPARASAPCDDAGSPQCRTFTVRRRFASGCNRRQGCVSVPLTSEACIVTCAEVKATCREKLGWPVARLLILGPDGEDIELANDEVLGDSVAAVIVEKDESATPAEREGAAFEGSVFRMVSAQA